MRNIRRRLDPDRLHAGTLQGATQTSSKDHAKKQGRDLDSFQFANDVDMYFTEDGEEAWNKMKNAVKVSLFKPELLKVHDIAQDSEFDFRRYFTEYTMDKPELMEQMKARCHENPGQRRPHRHRRRQA